MGYSLTIGELDVDYDQDEDCPNVSLRAKGFAHESAPAFGEITDHESSRLPSYSSWYDFCEFAGISELMGFEEVDGYKREDALIQNHPGVTPLTERHRKEVNEALDNFKNKYPSAVPTYGKKTRKLVGRRSRKPAMQCVHVPSCMASLLDQLGFRQLRKACIC